jgi:SAM-dependent methyltransferase
MPHTAWDSPSHPAEYDYLANAPRWLRRRFWEHFDEIKALPEYVSSIIEVGCATGELARYLIDRYPYVRYVGFDVSQSAIDRAREKCGEEFICGHFQDYDYHADLVICRDTVHHQPDPWRFLNDLHRISDRYLVTRLRVGPVTTMQKQVLYGYEVPYWILSQDALDAWAPKGFYYSDGSEPPLPVWLRSALWISRQCT